MRATNVAIAVLSLGACADAFAPAALPSASRLSLRSSSLSVSMTAEVHLSSSACVCRLLQCCSPDSPKLVCLPLKLGSPAAVPYSSGFYVTPLKLCAYVRPSSRRCSGARRSVALQLLQLHLCLRLRCPLALPRGLLGTPRPPRRTQLPLSPPFAPPRSSSRASVTRWKRPSLSNRILAGVGADMLSQYCPNAFCGFR